MSETRVMTPEFRVSFPHVFRPQAAEEGKEPKYGVSMLFKKGEDLSKLKAAANSAAVAKWGEDKTKWPKGLRLPFRDQGEKDLEGYEEGAVFINATSKQKPGLVNSACEDIISEEDFYAGCYARATINAFAYEAKGNKGVAFGLNNVQKLRDGEPLGGRVRASDDFEAVDSGGGSDDPFA